MLCGLIGEHLGHSFSPEIHGLLGDYRYELFELAPDALEDFFRRTDWRGVNVTIPYKKAVRQYCDTLSDTARRTQSVNTVVRDRQGLLHGYNTDYDGFRAMAEALGTPIAGEKALVLGSGGAGMTVCAALRDLGASQVITVSRGGPVTYEDALRYHADAALLVNATPVGMAPHSGVSPISLMPFEAPGGVLDLIYHPLRTALLLDAQARALPCANGLRMLAVQAARASELFCGAKIAPQTIENTIQALLCARENLVLIGMPGSGKTAAAKLLGLRTGRRVLDTDAMVTARTGKSIPQLFAQQGEQIFRQLEAEAVAEAGAMTGVIIATGGGAPLSEQNRRALRQNGRVFWLRRAVETLSRDGRPLSGGLETLRVMERERDAAYRACSDCEMDNNGTLGQTVDKILSSKTDGGVRRWLSS